MSYKEKKRINMDRYNNIKFKEKLKIALIVIRLMSCKNF